MLTGPMIARRSNARTAYGLMSDIVTYILEEPKRIYMAAWAIQGKEEIQYELGSDGPMCGTVGCIAGNALVLTNRNLPSSGISRIAKRVLGGNDIDLWEGLEVLFTDIDVSAAYGTKKYARIVAKRITKFQKQHEAELRAVQIRKP